MRITIIHTPADMERVGLLHDLCEILEIGSVEVRALPCGDPPQQQPHRTEPIGETEFVAGLRSHLAKRPPDAVVLSDRLNGSKYVARRLAREANVGVVTLKETLFPGRAYFAPDLTLLRRIKGKRTWKPLEDFERFRLEQFMDRRRSPIGGWRHGHLAEGGPLLLVVDHSSEYDAYPAHWHVTVVEAATEVGLSVLICERERDICTPDFCDQTLALHDGGSREKIPCDALCLEAAISACRCMVTNGSLLGLKALHIDKPVFVAGECVYSGMGFTHDVPFGEGFTHGIRRALARADLAAPPGNCERFLYDFIFRDLLTLEENGERFAEGTEGRVVDALFRAMPIERGARVLAGG